MHEGRSASCIALKKTVRRERKLLYPQVYGSSPNMEPFEKSWRGPASCIMHILIFNQSTSPPTRKAELGLRAHALEELEGGE